MQEAMARHMQPHSLAGAMYPGLPMSMYGNTGMSPMMHVPTPAPPAPVEPEKTQSNSTPREEGDGNYVQQLQSELNI